MKPITFILLMLPLCLPGQSSIYGWKSHASFNQMLCLAEMPGTVAGATASAVLITDRQGAKVTTISKSDGLSDSGISAISYNQSFDAVIIGYENGNLDLVQNGRIFNIPDITRKSNFPGKAIHRIYCDGNFAYLCCAFGIIKIDLKKRETAETWYLGPANSLVETFDLGIFMDKWWVATDHGLYCADMKNINLQDYRSWQEQTSVSLQGSSFSSLALQDGLLFTHDAVNDRLMAFNGTNWQQKFPEIKAIRKIRSSSSGLIVISSGEVWLTGANGSLRINNYLSDSSIKPDPRDAMVNAAGELWISDYRYGLTRKNGTTFQHIAPNSPVSDQITALKSGTENIFLATLTSGMDGSQASYSVLESGQWQNFTPAEDPGLKSAGPITSFAFGSENPDEYWASTAASGLYFFRKNRVAEHFNELNSALGSVNGQCTVNGLAFDQQHNLWYTNPTGTARLGTRSADGTFKPLPYPGMGKSVYPTGEIFAGSSNINWVVLPEEGLFAFRIKGTVENISDDQFRKLSVQSRFSNGSSTVIKNFRDISAITEDLSRNIWVGTGSGVVVYGNPESVFAPGEYYGTQPSADNTESVFQPILDKEKITAIAVDGGNRKWFGTARSGVFLFNENGDHLLRHFDSKNSPLPSDEILYIAISQVNGEVFFATSRGLVSYKSDATNAENNLDKMYAWPNPLRETYSGPVTIDGLTEGTDVKITDINGNLIYHTSSLGGRAVWDARNANGVRVSTGVYLIFCSSAQQKVSKIIKLLVIH